MSFIKHTWVTGERITPSLLNRIEDAIEELFDSGGGNIDYATDADCDALFDGFLEDE